MTEVAQQLRAVIVASTDISAHVAQAKDCYVKNIAGVDGFYQRFYERYFELSPNSKAKFDKAKVDWTRQRMLLDDAIERLLNYRVTQNEPTTLTRIADTHSRMGIGEGEFESFGQAFLDTLREVASLDTDAQFAWEAVLRPGLEYMKTVSRNAQITDGRKIA